MLIDWLHKQDRKKVLANIENPEKEDKGNGK